MNEKIKPPIYFNSALLQSEADDLRDVGHFLKGVAVMAPRQCYELENYISSVTTASHTMSELSKYAEAQEREE